MTRILVSLYALLALSTCAATSGGAVRPEPGEPNTAAYCANAPPEEQNCMACASKPGCGFCQEPVDGAPACQPGSASESQANGCKVPLTTSNEDCAAPPAASTY